MFEYLQNLTPYHWLTFACIIVILEIFGTSGFMLGISLASLTVFIIMNVVTITWHLQFMIFAVVSVIASIAWYWYQFKKDSSDEKLTKLNNKENQFIGQRITLDHDIEVGNGRIKFNDTSWPVYATEALKKGDIVEIIKVNGIFLHIEKVQD